MKEETYHQVLEIHSERGSLECRTLRLKPAAREVRTARPRYMYATAELAPVTCAYMDGTNN